MIQILFTHFLINDPWGVNMKSWTGGDCHPDFSAACTRATNDYRNYRVLFYNLCFLWQRQAKNRAKIRTTMYVLFSLTRRDESVESTVRHSKKIPPSCLSKRSLAVCRPVIGSFSIIGWMGWMTKVHRVHCLLYCFHFKWKFFILKIILTKIRENLL